MPTGRGRSATLSRRGFLRVGVAALTSPSLAACLEGPSIPAELQDGEARLDARPGVPTESVVLGESPLEISALGRDGLLYVPQTYDAATPAPLLVALHGATGSASNWQGFHTACETRGMVMLAVDSRGRTWDRVGGVFGLDVSFIDAALRHTFARVLVDEQRIALAGFSDGASYALSLGPSNGDLFRQLIAFSPGFSAPHPERIGQPRIWISHGRSDQILLESRTRTEIVPTLRSDGYEVRYVDFDGGHEVPPDIGGAALDWYLDS